MCCMPGSSSTALCARVRITPCERLPCSLRERVGSAIWGWDDGCTGKNQLLVIWYTAASWESAQVHCPFCFDAAANSEGQRLTMPLMSLVIDSAAQLATVGIAWSQYHDAVDCSEPVYKELLMTILQPLISHFELHILYLVKVANSWSISVLHEAEDSKKHYSWHEILFLKFQVWNDCLLVVYEC